MRRAGVSGAELRAAVARARERDGGGDADAPEWSAEEWARLWAGLTPHQQRVAFLVVFGGLSVAAAARRLRKSRGAVSGVWRRAVGRLAGEVRADYRQ